jgi:branched-chain amino acid transport system permease protein
MDIITIIQVAMSGLAFGGIYALVGSGFYIANRTTNTLNFGQGDFLMVGCFVTITFMRFAIPAYLIFFLVLLFLGGAGILLERVAIRPVATAGLSFVLTTMGFGMIIENVAAAVWGNYAQPFPSFFGGMKREIIHIGGIGFFPEEFFILLASLLVMLFFLFLLKRTITGKAFAAVAFNPDTASLMGVNVTRLKVTAYILASMLAGIAGFLIGPLTSVEPFMGLKFAIKGFVAGILGGFLNPVGILIGALILGLLENFTNLLTSQYGDMIAFLTVILVLLFRPSGLFKEQEIRSR